MPLRIVTTNSGFESEPLGKPFGFKGGYMSTMWQTAVWIRSEEGLHGLGLGTQNVLWSDPGVFTSTSESAGNSIMFAITDYALRLARQTGFETPVDLQEQIMDELYRYGKQITGLENLNKTFVLNALVPVDNAAWILYARSSGIRDFDTMIPEAWRGVFTHRHEKVASVPLSPYALKLDEIRKLVEQDGYFILKLKLGSPGSQKEMLAWDKARLEAVHNVIGGKSVAHTRDGKVPYYLDMNGRYENKETLRSLLDHADKIGAFDQIMVVEEPFPESYTVPVDDLGVMVVADESAHDAENVVERVELGYGAIALKPAAKTLSMTLKMAAAAQKRNIPCFCADLTVNPILVDWNKNVAARLAPLSGLDIGLLETNGHQNYADWKRMMAYHPYANASWIRSSGGVFHLDASFYEKSGGIFDDSDHYLNLVKL